MVLGEQRAGSKELIRFLAEAEAVAAVNHAHVTIQVAHQEWRESNVAAAVALLDATRADLRGWERRYVHRLCHSEMRTLIPSPRPGSAQTGHGSSPAVSTRR